MATRAFTLQRICNFAGKMFDPDSDEQVNQVLRDKFNISLPQRRTMNDALAAVSSDHDIIALILQYRTMA